MLVLWWVALAISIGVIAGLQIWGMFLPKERAAKSVVDVNTSLEQVWRIITDWPAQPTWRKDLTKVQIIDSTHFVEYTKHGLAVRFEVSVHEQASRLLLRMSGPSSGSVEIRLSEISSGTHIELIERIVHRRAIRRVFAHCLFDLQAFTDRYLQELTTRLDSSRAAGDA